MRTLIAQLHMGHSRVTKVGAFAVTTPTVTDTQISDPELVAARLPLRRPRGERGRRHRDRRDQDRHDRHRGGEKTESTQYSAQQDKHPREHPDPRGSPWLSKLEALLNPGEGVTDYRNTRHTNKQSNELVQPANLLPLSLTVAHRMSSRELPKETEAEGRQVWEEQQPIDEEAEIQRRRQRREELLRKSRASTPLHLLALQADKTAASDSG